MEDITEKDTLLFIHGLTGGAWVWEESYVPYFKAKGYNCIAINLAGHEKPGYVSGIHKYSLEDYVRTVSKIVEGLKTPPIIMGHSMGGRILQLYLKNGGICKKAVLVASVPIAGALKASLRVIGKHPGSIKHLIKRDFLSFGKAYPYTFFREDVPAEKMEKYKNLLCSESFKAYLQLMLPIANTENVKACPLLVIGGDKDKLFTVKEFEYMAEHYNADLKIVKGASHGLMLDPNSLDSAAYILKWLEQ